MVHWILLISFKIIFGQFKYEFEFINEKIYTPCEDYPNNFIDNLFDMSNVNFDQTEDGSIVVNGYCTVENTVDRLYPVIFNYNNYTNNLHIYSFLLKVIYWSI